MFLILSKNYFVSFPFVSLRASSEVQNKNWKVKKNSTANMAENTEKAVNDWFALMNGGL